MDVSYIFDDLNEAQRIEVTRYARRLHDAGYAHQPVKLGYFLGQLWLVALAERDGTAGTAIVDADEIHWYPAVGQPRPMGSHEASCIHKGRKLLETFNR